MEWNKIELKWHEMVLRLQAKPSVSPRKVDKRDLPHTDAEQAPKASPPGPFDQSASRAAV